ncbi:MAG TPA: GYD domain-containing protein [Nitrospirae bacterium]|nr:GYD domain-containing protein [Nitrospirota bacterium]
MAIYIALSNLTDEGRKTIKQKPDRIQEANKEIEAMGIKVLEQYAVLGPHDFVTLLDAPDNEAVMKMSVEPVSGGTVQLVTLPALTVDDFIKTLK